MSKENPEHGSDFPMAVSRRQLLGSSFASSFVAMGCIGDSSPDQSSLTSLPSPTTSRQPTPEPDTDDWPQPRHDQFNSSHNAGATIPESPPERQWTFPNGTENDDLTGPGMSRATVANGSVYVGSDDTNLYSINPLDGTVEWRFGAIGIWTDIETSGVRDRGPGGRMTTPAIANGLAHVGNEDGNLYAVNVDSGELAWWYPTRERISEAPVISNEGVFAISSERQSRRVPHPTSTVHALNHGTGDEKWKFEADEIEVPPAISNGIVVVCDGSEMVGLDSTTGNTIWSNDEMKDANYPPCISGESIFQTGSKLYSVDINNGSIRWEHTPTNGDFYSLSVTEEYAYVVNANGLHSVSLDGTKQWEKELNGFWPDSIITASNGLLMLGEKENYDKTLRALDLDSGEQFWEVSLQGSDQNLVGGQLSMTNNGVFISNFVGTFSLFS